MQKEIIDFLAVNQHKKYNRWAVGTHTRVPCFRNQKAAHHTIRVVLRHSWDQWLIYPIILSRDSAKWWSHAHTPPTPMSNPLWRPGYGLWPVRASYSGMWLRMFSIPGCCLLGPAPTTLVTFGAPNLRQDTTVFILPRRTTFVPVLDMLHKSKLSTKKQVLNIDRYRY